MSGHDAFPTEPRDARRTDGRGRAVLLAVIAVLAVAVVVLVVLLVLRDGDDGASGPSPTATEPSVTETTPSSEAPPSASEPSTSEAPSPTEPSPPSQEPSQAPSLTEAEAASVVWPDPGPGSSFTDPVATVRAFAEDLVGFTDPAVGEFQAGDSRSGEVEVRAQTDGPVTTVMARQMSDDHWYVIAAVTEQIAVSLPAPGSTIDNPLRVEGEAMAFEGNVRVAVYAHPDGQPRGVGAVTGRGDGVMGPFSGEITWDKADGGQGFVLFAIDSAKDGSPWQVAALPVRLGNGS